MSVDLQSFVPIDWMQPGNALKKAVVPDDLRVKDLSLDPNPKLI